MKKNYYPYIQRINTIDFLMHSISQTKSNVVIFQGSICNLKYKNKRFKADIISSICLSAYKANCDAEKMKLYILTREIIADSAEVKYSILTHFSY